MSDATMTRGFAPLVAGRRSDVGRLHAAAPACLGSVQLPWSLGGLPGTLSCVIARMAIRGGVDGDSKRFLQVGSSVKSQCAPARQGRRLSGAWSRQGISQERLTQHGCANRMDAGMTRKDRIDAAGALALVGFSLLLAFNQVVIRVVNEGLQPVFFAGVRSVGVVLCLWLWFAVRRRPLGLKRKNLFFGCLMGTLFALEFVFLFIALDLTTVSRTSVLFNTMPLWMALFAHVLIPGERITRVKAAGQLLAFLGAAVAIAWRGDGGEGALLGDLLALLGAIGWAALALIARTGLKDVSPDRQLFWQVLVSTPILLVAAVFFGPFVRELEPIHLWGLAFQIVVVVTFGFSFWLWLLAIYPAASVAAFSFLVPVFGVFLGWWLLDETLGLPILVALGLVCVGLVLINRPSQVPQNV